MDLLGRRPTKTAPRRPQDGPRRPQDGPREAQGVPKACPRRSKGGPKGAQGSPREPKGVPRGTQGCPEGAQVAQNAVGVIKIEGFMGGPMGGPRGPKGSLREPKGHPKDSKRGPKSLATIGPRSRRGLGTVGGRLSGARWLPGGKGGTNQGTVAEDLTRPWAEGPANFCPPDARIGCAIARSIGYNPGFALKTPRTCPNPPRIRGANFINRDPLLTGAGG